MEEYFQRVRDNTGQRMGKGGGKKELSVGWRCLSALNQGEENQFKPKQNQSRAGRGSANLYSQHFGKRLELEVNLDFIVSFLGYRIRPFLKLATGESTDLSWASSELMALPTQ